MRFHYFIMIKLRTINPISHKLGFRNSMLGLCLLCQFVREQSGFLVEAASTLNTWIGVLSCVKTNMPGTFWCSRERFFTSCTFIRFFSSMRTNFIQKYTNLIIQNEHKSMVMRSIPFKLWSYQTFIIELFIYSNHSDVSFE